MSTFKRACKTLTSADSTVYVSPPSGAIIVGMLAAHNGNNKATYGINVKVRRAGLDTYILGKGTQVFARGALSIDSGKIVLEPGDTILAHAISEDATKTDSVVDLSISLMEV